MSEPSGQPGPSINSDQRAMPSLAGIVRALPLPARHQCPLPVLWRRRRGRRRRPARGVLAVQVPGIRAGLASRQRGGLRVGGAPAAARTAGKAEAAAGVLEAREGHAKALCGAEERHGADQDSPSRVQDDRRNLF